MLDFFDPWNRALPKEYHFQHLELIVLGGGGQFSEVAHVEKVTFSKVLNFAFLAVIIARHDP